MEGRKDFNERRGDKGMVGRKEREREEREG
jgi:hypothetical protein